MNISSRLKTRIERNRQQCKCFRHKSTKIDINDIIDTFKKYKDVIVDFNLNNPTRILPGSPLAINKDNAIHYTTLDTDSDFTRNWYSNSTNYSIRIERFFRFHNQLNKNHFKRSYAGGDFNYYKTEYLKYTKSPNKEILKIINAVINERYYRSTKFYS